MALEIKVLDYGDVELEASFLVLGRDCGRTRRASGVWHADTRRHLADPGRYRLPLEPDFLWKRWACVAIRATKP